jgi:hypothetical protein
MAAEGTFADVLAANEAYAADDGAGGRAADPLVAVPPGPPVGGYVYDVDTSALTQLC